MSTSGRHSSLVTGASDPKLPDVTGRGTRAGALGVCANRKRTKPGPMPRNARWT